MGWTIWVEKEEMRIRGQTYDWKEDIKQAGFRFRKVGFDPEWWRPTPQDPKAILKIVDIASQNLPEGFRITLIVGGREATFTRKDHKLWIAKMRDGRPVPIKEVA